MNDETALAGGFDEYADRSLPPYRNERREPSASAAPRLILEIPLEGRVRAHIEASSREDELRLRDWLRRALIRRKSLSADLSAWLDALDEREREAA